MSYYETMSSKAIQVLDHGFVRLDGVMADDLSVVNAARVSFARYKEVMDDAGVGLIRFLMRERHSTPFEHNAFRFHIRCPIFVAREWFRHRSGCLTAETVVTFVDTYGHAKPVLRKTMGEIWSMWAVGERDGHAVPPETARRVKDLAAAGHSLRSISRSTGVGRQRGIETILNGTNAKRSARSRLRKMRLRVLNENTNEFETGHIAEVIDQGLQPVYRLTLSDGTQITLTENHRVLTDTGWKTMGMAVGLVGNGTDAVMSRSCRLLVNGIPVHQSKEWLKEQRSKSKSVREIADEARCSYHTIRKWLRIHGLQFSQEERYRSRPAWNKGLSGYRINRVFTPEQLAAIRQARSGPRSNWWRGGLSTKRQSIGAWTTRKASSVHQQFDYTCQRCKQRGGRLHAHHIIPVWLDDTKAMDIGNLVTLCRKCHIDVHRTQESEIEFARDFSGYIGRAIDLPAPIHGWRLTAHAVSVERIEYIGVEQTYDLSVGGPWHNFVANGVVVHNSFNELSLRYAKASDEFFVPYPEDVRTQTGKPGAYIFEMVDRDLANEFITAVDDAYDLAFATYSEFIQRGVAREIARIVLPVGIYTEFYWTVNARNLMHFLSLRNAETAQLEIRRYAEACERFLAEAMPVTYQAFVDNGRKM